MIVALTQCKKMYVYNLYYAKIIVKVMLWEIRDSLSELLLLLQLEFKGPDLVALSVSSF